MILIVVVTTAMTLVLISAIFIWLWKKKVTRGSLNFRDEQGIGDENSILLDLERIRVATCNFSVENKLGEGGFGPVYKGKLSNGQQIAVKRLLRSSGQGIEELRNEVALVAKLQHRNLVKLLGYCLEEEKLLVYEYLPNKSLDKFLFDPVNCEQLNWNIRYKIIEGIARGLLYLHKDSRLKVIHRDLKASNILLDGEMNPKISDFGLAKLFGSEQSEGKTSRIAGTYGYMAPEYVISGRLSTKSDIYSFGVLILEIVTGRRSIGYRGTGHAADLLSYVWQHWEEGKIFEVLDQRLVGSYPEQQALRCINIGLLCVQEDPNQRPNMSSVVLMLSSQAVEVQPPSNLAFFSRVSTSTTLSNVLPEDEELVAAGDECLHQEHKPIDTDPGSKCLI